MLRDGLRPPLTREPLAWGRQYRAGRGGLPDCQLSRVGGCRTYGQGVVVDGADDRERPALDLNSVGLASVSVQSD